MYFSTRIKEAIGSLASHKLRSFLALLGILVGTASVLAIVSGGQLATEQALKQFEQLGTNILSVSLYYDYPGPGKTVNYLDLDEIINLPRMNQGVERVTAYVTTYATVSYKGKRLDASIAGVGKTFFNIANLSLLEGREVSLIDQSGYFCVLGNKIYKSLGTAGSVIGKQILLNNRYFTIVGVLDAADENPFLNVEANSTIFIPEEASRLLSKDAHINHLLIRTTLGIDTEALKKSLTNYINENAAKSRLYFDSSDLIVKNMKKQRQIFTVFLGFIGGISLLVGGVGVMNIMLISISERRQEIGIRMAIGANRWDIMLLFLSEAVILSLLGGIFGITLGEIITFVIAKTKHWQYHVFFFPPLLGFSVSMVAGVFFGFYPAFKASKLRPIETLRAE